jgi:hypothetical protein
MVDHGKNGRNEIGELFTFTGVRHRTIGTGGIAVFDTAGAYLAPLRVGIGFAPGAFPHFEFITVAAKEATVGNEVDWMILFHTILSRLKG